jgi:hypothetical protein
VTFYALQKWRASMANQMLPLMVRKSNDEPVNNATTGATLQDDNELFLTVSAGVTYSLEFAVLANQASGTGIGIDIAWTMPSLCVLDLAVAGPHLAWTSSPAQLEAEWAAWQNETSSPTSKRSFGTTSSAVFSYHFRGSLLVGVNGGDFRMQWAQHTANATNVTVKKGSRLWAQPVPS